MRYNERAQIITTSTTEGYLGGVEKENKPILVPCAVSGLSTTDKATYLRDNYKADAYRIHFRGNLDLYKNLKYVVFRNKKLEVVSSRILFNRLVVIVS